MLYRVEARLAIASETDLDPYLRSLYRLSGEERDLVCMCVCVCVIVCDEST